MGFPWGLVLLWLATRGSHATTVNVTLLLYDERLCAINSSLFEAAASMAVTRSQLPPTVRMRIEYVHTEDDDDCSETGGLLEIFQVMNDPRVGAVIGSVASPVCQAAVSLAALRAKPFVSWSCSGLTASARHSATFARTVPPAWHVAQALVSLIRHYGWKYSVVVTTDDGQWPPLGYEIDMVLREARHIVRNFIILHRHGTLREAKERLAGIGPLVKAIILCMDVTSSAIYSVMQAADELGMLNGGYTFLALHVLYTLRPQALPNIPNNHVLQSLFIMTFISPNATYLQSWDDDLDLNPIIHIHSDNASQADDYIFQQVYDSVALFASALKRTIEESRRRPFNLTHLLRHTKDVTFQGFLGPVIMNGKGDRDVTYVLLSYDTNRQRFRSAVWITNNTVVEDSDREWYADRLVLPDPPCVLYEKDCLFPDRGVALSPAHIVAVVFCSLLITFSAIFVAIMVRRRILQNEMTKGPNKIIILPDDLVFVSPRSLSAGRKAFDFKPSESLEGMLLHHFKVTSLGWPHGRGFLKDTVPQLNDFANLEKPDLLKGSHDSLRGKTNSSSVSARPLWDENTTKARYNGDLVHVKYLHLQTFEIKNKTMKELKLLHELRHENLNPFLGLLADPQHPALIYEYCSRGSLEDIIASEDIKLDWAFKLSLLTDLVRGMKYLHSSAVRVHGSLTSRNCVIDSRWVLKITDYGLRSFMDPQSPSTLKRSAKEHLWTAPELLRDENVLWRGTQMGDVYAFGIIIQEVVVRGPPYCMLSLTPEEIIEKVKHPPPMIRPSVSKQAAPPEAINIMRQCWAEIPDMRPDFNAINEHFKKLNQGKKVNIVDTMFQMLEKYSNNLEELIRERTEQLAEEKKKTEQLLHRMLPSTVAEKLMLGMPVEPEAYEEVTIYFSDIVGFTTISAYSTPMEIVDLLNDLYTCFDATINGYDVYKVETIGDAYMVVGGLPVRIEDHACQVASMALDLLHQSARFQIRHMPSTPLKLRIGVHTGPCCAGVVGLTMPRYCLFGDTVNTASRMESTGQAFRIHISETTKAKLDEAGGYRLQYRGETELKGKGKAMTFWLLGKEGFDKELPVPSDDEGESHGLDEEVVRRGRLSSVSYQQQALFLSTPPLSQLARGLSIQRVPADVRLPGAQKESPNKDITLPVRSKPSKDGSVTVTVEQPQMVDGDVNSNKGGEEISTKTHLQSTGVSLLQTQVSDKEVGNISCRSNLNNNNTQNRFNKDPNGNSPVHCPTEATTRSGDWNGNITGDTNNDIQGVSNDAVGDEDPLTDLSTSERIT